MLNHTLHPNTRAMLQAWRRMAAFENDTAGGPAADDYPGLLSRLFVIAPKDDGPAPFRIAGEKLPELLGRDLTDMDFLTLWHGPDRSAAAAALRAVQLQSSPALIKARGETLTGRSALIEIALAPLDGVKPGRARILGLYQGLSGEKTLGGHPLARHCISAIVMPQPRPRAPHLRLVANND